MLFEETVSKDNRYPKGTIDQHERFLLREILREKKCARLAQMCGNAENEKSLELTIDRSPVCFGAILSYYQIGELHIPPGVCLGAFRREMEFWEVEFDALYECCLYRYQAFIDDEETRRQFLHKALLPMTAMSPVTTGVNGNIKKFRSRLWKIMDTNENTLAAKFYFILVLLMVLLSIFVLAYSTEPSMRRRISKCELIEYMKSTGSEHLQQVYERIGSPDCSRAGSWDYEEFDMYQYDWYYYEFSWDELEDMALPGISDVTAAEGVQPAISNSSTTPPPSGNPLLNNTSDQTATDRPIVHDPTANDFVTFPQKRQSEKPVKRKIDIPLLTVPKLPFYILDITISVFFSIDFILRLMSCPSLRRYFQSIINIFDGLALIACYIYYIIVTVEKQYRYKDSDWLNLLEFAQVFRALRLFRVVKNVRASRVLAYSLTQNVRDIALLITLLIVGISSFACLFYFAESHETIPSIPNAWYWAIVTMTTVGYGDISPKTGTGRVIASICAICGVLLLAVTLPMFVNNFLTLYQYSCVTESIEKRKGKKKTERNVTKDKSPVVINDVDGDPPPAYKTSKNTIDKYSENMDRKVPLFHVKEAFVK